VTFRPSIRKNSRWLSLWRVAMPDSRWTKPALDGMGQGFGTHLERRDDVAHGEACRSARGDGRAA